MAKAGQGGEGRSTPDTPPTAGQTIDEASDEASDEAIAFGRKFGLGCFTFVIGFFSGGMVAVLLGRIMAGLRKAPSCDGLPLCNWWVYVGIGGLVGAISLPTLVLRRLSGKR